MDNSEYYIKRIKIDGLFGYKNIDWHLHKDVNILGGINGSGKSTVINLLNGFFCYDLVDKNASSRLLLCNSAEIEFYSGLMFYFKKDVTEGGVDPFQQIEKKYINSEWGELSSIKLLVKRKDSQKRTYGSFLYKLPEAKGGKELELLTTNIFYLSSAEHQIVSEETTENISSSNVKTTLDLSLFQEIRSRNELVTQISLNQNGDLPSLQEQNGLLIKILNSFFKDTKKRLHEDTTVFNVLTPQGEKISCYDLSTGEKQLLLIFLAAFNSNKKPCIMLMDEPDLGIHIDWKKKLISSIRELNPNAQLILSTHSPSMIEGWFDNVKEMDEITTNA